MRKNLRIDITGLRGNSTPRLKANKQPVLSSNASTLNGDSIGHRPLAKHSEVSPVRNGYEQPSRRSSDSRLECAHAIPVEMESYRGKRVFDLTCVALTSPFALAMGIGCAIAIRVTSRGPIFFRQERVGAGGVPFTVIKFRTMLHDPEKSNPLFPDPAVITLVGKWLRRLSLDELPQLINILLGEMSIVGPRPTLPYQIDRYSERQRLRLLVRPGLTGLAQIRGRNGLLWTDRIEHDIEYLKDQSLLLDAIIVYKTIFAIAGGTGVGGHFTDDSLATLED